MAELEQVETKPEGVDADILHEAKSQGWVEKDHYRGNPNDWVDAEKFVQRGREILPILRKNNASLIADLQQTKEQLKEFRQAAEEFKTFQKESYERKVQDYETRLSQLRESKAQAISDGDGQKVNALDEQLDATKADIKEARQAVADADKPLPMPPVPTNIDPVLQTWLDRNTWFGQDRRLTAVANGVGESLRLEFPSLKGEAFLEKLDEVLQEELPNRFKPKIKPNGSAVESGSGRQPRGGTSSHSYDNLPPEAKAACDRFTKQKLMTREQYLQEYEWE